MVTDVAGVKAPLAAQLPHPGFVGGHPMAGSEQVGIDGADPDLFVGATWVLTPTATTDPDAYARLQSVVTSLGAEVLALSPEQHDTLVAMVSHVPHLTAATLMNLADRAAEEHGALLRLAAGGFRDMTRIAAGQPGIWPDVCAENAPAIVAALDTLLADLSAMRDRVAAADRAGLLAELEHAAVARRSLPARAVRPERLAELRVPVPDRPGVLAEITTLAGDLGVNIHDIEIAHSVEGDRGVLVLVVDGDARRAPPRRPHRARLPVDVEAPRMSRRRPVRSRHDDGPVFTVEGGRPLRGPGAGPGRQVGVAPRPPPGRAGRGGVGGAGAVRRRRRGAHRRRPLRALGARSTSTRRRGRRWSRGARPPCTSRTGLSTWATRAPPCACWPGWWPGRPFTTRLTGDASLSERPMDRVAVPLRLMGADGRGPHRALPAPAHHPGRRAARHRLHHADGQRPGEVVRAAGRPRCRGRHRGARAGAHPAPHRGAAGLRCGATLTEEDGPGTATWCGCARRPWHPSSSTCPATRPRPPSGSWPPASCRAATSPSSASTWGAAGAASSTCWPAWGPTIDEVPATGPGDLAATADIVARFGPLQGTEVDAAEITGLDEVPVLAVAAACAVGRHGVSRRGGAAGEGVRPPGRRGRARAPRSGPGPRSRATTSGSTAPVDWCPARSTPAATTAWPWPRRWPAWRRGPGPPASRGGTPWPPATRASPPTWPRSPGRTVSDERRRSADERVVAIDGPAGAGKSTLAQSVAEHLGVERLDTGAMYRAVAWEALRHHVDVDRRRGRRRAGPRH